MYPGGYSSGGIVDAGISASPPPKTSDDVELELLIVSGSGSFSVRLPGVNIELTGRCASVGCPKPSVFSGVVTSAEDVDGGVIRLSGVRKS